MPDGKLFCTTHGQYTKWYLSTKNSCAYIPKKERHLAEQLAFKKMLLLQLKALKNEKQAIDSYLRHHKADLDHAYLLFYEKPEYKELLSPCLKPLSQELADWMNSPYQTNQLHPEQLQYKTSSGILVRSKSETIIELLLHMHKIPYRYECALQLDKVTLFPDFTIRHPKTGEVFYWEHFGMIDEPAYQKNTLSKLQLYAVHGIFPTINLLATYETKASPLCSEYAETLIKHYFL